MQQFQCKVNESIQELASILDAYMSPLPKTSSGVYALNTLYYIKHGAILILNDGRALSPLVAPDFIGIHFVLGQSISSLKLEFKLLPGAEVYMIDAHAAKSEVFNKNSYESVAYLIARRLYEFCDITKTFTSTNSNAYKKVKTAIELYHNSQDILKDDISLSSFIIEYTGISKSRVMFILSELKKGGHIATQDGRVLIASKLPSEF
ncbi:helix-turn-helix domain-containing protein [Serratia oryzae]|uniref:IprA winged helix-turn-helix domain-containing protein n=1 Tax=Serratia oryzae TaxID=2034155 RepID=A0A1S8CJP0_9GAMM|nr:helix-turn-helix domain-containing protein [Serratia oryzae]OMQ21774.1 hypothetical protein BMI79_13765 [Serratia oryzae]